VLNSEWLTIGPMVEAFESEISNLVGADTFVVTSGTAALHCAYAAIDIKPGDEIITPALTFVATQTTAMHFGAKIIFCDIDNIHEVSKVFQKLLDLPNSENFASASLFS
jgi:dTDP-4-amino-4,6-dideoxygalactose transaminase